MAITGTVSLVTQANLNYCANAGQAVHAELLADFPEGVLTLSPTATPADWLAALTSIWHQPYATMVKYMDSTNTPRGFDLFYQLDWGDVVSALTVTDKSLATADRQTVAKAMLKAAVQRMVNTGLGAHRFGGRVKAGGNYDTTLQQLAQQTGATRTLSDDGLYAMYWVVASALLGVL